MAYKCDRCGKFYVEQKESPHYVCDYDRGQLDFCEECVNDLETFMNVNGGDEIATKNN